MGKNRKKLRVRIRLDRKRAVSDLAKQERYAFVIDLLGRHWPRPLVIRAVMKQYQIGQAMAYRVFDKAVEYAKTNTANLSEVYVGHLAFLQRGMDGALKDGAYGAAAMLSDQFAEMTGLKRPKDQPSVNVVLNNNNVNQQTQQVSLEHHEQQLVLARDLTEMSKEQLNDRLSRFILPVRSADAANGNGRAGGTAAALPGPQPSSERGGTEVEPVEVPVSPASVRRSG